MATDKDIYNAVKQVLTELVLPQLEALKEDIRRLEKKLDAPRPTVSKGTKRPLGPRLSPRAHAYVDALIEEVNERTERDAEKWARQKAKD